MGRAWELRSGEEAYVFLMSVTKRAEASVQPWGWRRQQQQHIARDARIMGGKLGFVVQGVNR